MGWIPKIISIIAGPVAGAAAGVVTGEKPGDAIKDAVTAPIAVPVDVAAAAVGAAATVDAKLTELEASLVGKIGGDKARNLFLDVRRLVMPVDAQTQAQLLDSASHFVETLQVEYLDPIGAALAAELQRARNDSWDRAMAIPDDVIGAMPADLATLARAARYILVSDVNTLSLPAFAIDHFNKADAVTAIDLIFFRNVPGALTLEDRHFWAHELTHARQYSTIGLIAFAQRYFHNSVNQALGGPLNELEEEADVNACRSFRIANPRYITSCNGV